MCIRDRLEDGTGTMSPMGYFNVAVTWTYSDGKLVITDAQNASKTYTATIEGTKATVTYSDTLAGNELTETFTCDDISAITSAPAAPETLALFTSADGDTLTVYADGTAQVSAFGGMLKPTFNWTYEGGTLKFTDSENAEKVYTAVISGTSATLEYKETFVTVNFTCDDISALIK